jgi:hypothetical protein
MPKFSLGMMADDRVSVTFFLAVNALLTAVAQPGNDFALYLRVEQIEADFRGRLNYENEIDL